MPPLNPRYCARCGVTITRYNRGGICYGCRWDDFKPKTKLESKSTDWFIDKLGNLTRLHGDV